MSGSRPEREPRPQSARYAFRPSAFRAETVVTVDAAGITVDSAGRDLERIAFGDVTSVELLPASDADGHALTVLHLKRRRGRPIEVKSATWSGGGFEFKGPEFSAFLLALHQRLAPRAGEVKFLFGQRKAVIHAWRAALLLTLAAGILAAAAAAVTAEPGLAFGALAAILFGGTGFWSLRGVTGQRAYQPGAMASALAGSLEFPIGSSSAARSTTNVSS